MTKQECRELMDKLYLLMDEELDGHEIEALRGHLKGCGSCLERLDVEKSFKSMVKRCLEVSEMPAGLYSKVRASLESNFEEG